MIQARNKLSQEELSEAKKLIDCCQGYGSYLAKYLVNQLIEQNDKGFQIAVEDSNVGAKRLYEKIGFVKQTQVVYLNEKGARDSEV